MATFAMYKISDEEQLYLGDVEADDEQEAINQASNTYHVDAWCLLTISESIERT